MIRAAAGGDAVARDLFATRYAPVVRAYLAARWRHSHFVRELDDAVQEVFLACLQPEGLLDRADSDRGEFRPFLYGAVRNIARRVESAPAARSEQFQTRRRRGGRAEPLSCV